MARPRAGDWLAGEIAGLREAGVGMVVSLLEKAEVEELGLEAESSPCAEHGIQFVSFPIADRGVPEDADRVSDLCSLISAFDSPVAIHCRAGIGRSALVAASVLRKAGMDTDLAFDLIGQARGLLVPDTEAQKEWVRDLGGCAGGS